jgi:hypothetical protein
VGSNSTKFKYDPTAEIRTHDMYMAQLKVALRTKKPYKGIKDFTYFSKYVEFPTGVTKIKDFISHVKFPSNYPRIQWKIHIVLQMKSKI